MSGSFFEAEAAGCMLAMAMEAAEPWPWWRWLQKQKVGWRGGARKRKRKVGGESFEETTGRRDTSADERQTHTLSPASRQTDEATRVTPNSIDY